MGPGRSSPSAARPARRSRTRRLLWLLVLAALLVEVVLSYRFYETTSAAAARLRALRDDLDLATLEQSEAEILALRSDLERASAELAAARRHVDRDPLIRLAGALPVVGDQARGLRRLVQAGEASAATGLAATDVLLAYARLADDPARTSIQEGVAFLQEEGVAMAVVRDGLEELKRRRAAVPDRLVGPLAAARGDLDDAIERLEGLVGGYERANALLPALLGFEGPRRYLVLPQNETELFPSGGLISNYGLAVFDEGRLTELEFEYFVNLFDRWQATSGGEYVEPPPPLEHYLLREVSWGLGEAGWYPDFPTTAVLANDFVQRGGGPPTDGTIAVDLQFVEALLGLIGPVEVGDYGVTVTAANLSEVALTQTRGESAVPGAPGKAFLSSLAAALLDRVFAAEREEWVGLLRLLDEMGRTRHLQVYFEEPRLQALAGEYGLDGTLRSPAGDYLLIADTSVNSTKLNLILETRAEIELRLDAAGTAETTLTYTLTNPFPAWREGRDPRLVSALMLDGVYGSYQRLYLSPGARLIDWRLDGETAGVEQNGLELGRRVVGRYVPVLPGATRQSEIVYRTRGIVEEMDLGARRYRLYLQKQPGTRALPLQIRYALPAGATLEGVLLDGEAVAAGLIETDLGTDRTLEIRYRLAP